MDRHNLTPEQAELERKRHLNPEFPQVFSISLGEWPCNRTCRMCPMFSNPPKQSRYMPEDVFVRACETVGNRSVQIEISAYSEPYMHPRMDDFVDISRKKCPNAAIFVATNGSLLDEERCIRIVESGITDIAVSLDAGSAESYKWLTGSGEYDKVCANLERLIETKNKRNAKHLCIKTHIIGIHELRHEFKGFLKRWTGLADVAYIRAYNNWAGQIDPHGLTPSSLQDIPAERYPCSWPWYATQIQPTGDVFKCCFHITNDGAALGNIMKEDFVKIWQGDKMEKLRQLQCANKHDEITHCGACTVWSLFPHFWRKSESPEGEFFWE